MSFTYGGVNCESMGMFVEKYPSRSFPTKKVTTYNILGRNGDLIVEHGGYSNVIQEYEVYVNDSGSGLQANLSAIARWLLYDVSGYAKLTDSYDPTIFREARIIGADSFLNALNQYGKATLQFDCKPQRFPIAPDKYSITGTTSASFTIPSDAGKMPGSPIITIRNVDVQTLIQIDVNGDQIFQGTTTSGYPQTVVVDFENRTVSGNFYNTSLIPVRVNWDTNMVDDGDVITLTVGNSVAPQTIDAEIYIRRWQL